MNKKEKRTDFGKRLTRFKFQNRMYLTTGFLVSGNKWDRIKDDGVPITHLHTVHSPLPLTNLSSPQYPLPPS